jgi:two-component system response regulator PilR (NtrC family)
MTAAPSQYSLLVVDDEPDLRTLYELTLLREGYEVETAASVDDAWLHLQDRRFSAVITDMRLPDGSGLELLQRLEQAGRAEKAIVITAYGSADNAVQALKAGAYDYLTKPVDLRQFRTVVASALGRAEAPSPPGSAAAAVSGAAAGSRMTPRPPDEPRLAAPRRPADALAMPLPAAAASPARGTVVSDSLRRMVGTSEAMRQVRALIDKVARSMAPVWIRGESGTGKELVAHAIHDVGVRASQPFIAVNCGAIPEQLLEAEFFGYRKGAFTGAAEDREGFFQAAKGGTLFLDEIGDLPLAMQSKLLRAIQERAVRPVGAVSEVTVDVRIISATHKDLAFEVEAGRFRQDLYYRLNVIQIFVPPLRERMEDLAVICSHLLQRIAAEAQAAPLPLSAAALQRLQQHDFPGNVRELENLLHRAVALCSGQAIEPEDIGLPALPAKPSDDWPRTEAAPLPASALGPDGLPADLAQHLDAVEREILVRALNKHNNNRTAAGSSLGLTLRQMRYRMARLGITGGDWSGSGDDAGDEGRAT